MKTLNSRKTLVMSKEISRREFLKIAGWGLSGAVAGGTAATLLDLLNPDNVQKGQFQETSTTPNAEPTVTNTSTPNINKPSSTLEPTGTTTAEKTATPESTEEPKEYEFRIGNVRLDKPFLFVLPGTISGGLGYSNGLEIPIYEPVANREKLGYPSETELIYRDYRNHPQSALVVQSDIYGHDVVNIHSFSYGDKILPGEAFRRVKDRGSIENERFQLAQLVRNGDSWDRIEGQESELVIVDISTVDGEVYENSDGRPDASYGSQKFVFFRTDLWNLSEGDRARRPNQVTFVTCDGRYVTDNVSKFSKRLLITAELVLPEDDRKALVLK